MEIFLQDDSDSANHNVKSDKDPIYSTLIKKNKVSTAVGSSSGAMKEIKQVSDGSVQTYDFVEVKSVPKEEHFSTSTGTSPPPQNIATQVRKHFNI